MGKTKTIENIHMFSSHFQIWLKRKKNENDWDIHKYEFERVNVEINVEQNRIYPNSFHLGARECWWWISRDWSSTPKSIHINHLIVVAIIGTLGR